MIIDDNCLTEKKRQKKILSFLSNGKFQFLNTMGYQPTSTSKKEALVTRGIFGAPLKSASLCGSCNEYGLTVPDPVYRCFDEIMRRGFLVEGIFRLSGAAPEVENLFMDFDRPPTYGKYMDLKSYDIHAIAGVAKKFLRQLPNPAIPIVCHEDFLHLYDQSFSKKATVNTLALMIQQLPREHFHLIHYIIIMASSIQKHATVNMMNPEALAIVLAPVCTGLENNLKEIPSWVKRHARTKMMNDMGHLIETNRKWTKIWTLLIECSDTLLDIWKDALLWDTPQGHKSVPCSTSSNSYLKNVISPPSSPVSHPNRHSHMDQTELLLDVAPPLNKHPIQRRPSHYSNKSSDELYKVVVMRTRQNTACKSLKSTKRSSLVMDASSYHQYYSSSITSPTVTHSSSDCTTTSCKSSSFFKRRPNSMIESSVSSTSSI